MVTLRDQIEADIAAETRSAAVKAVFAEVAQAKRATEGDSRPDWKSNRPDYRLETLSESPDPEGDSSDGFDYVHAAEGDYRGVCENQTGRFISDQAFQTLRDRRAEMDAQTVEIARALEVRGEKFYNGPTSSNAVTVIGLYSGAILPLPSVRRVAFLPSVAAQNRAKMLRDIEHFIGCYPAGCRMFTVTSGPRLVLESPEQFREGVQKFSRFISKVNYDLCGKRGTLKHYGVSIQWRALEFGTPQFDLGKLTLHLHAHLLMKEARPMTPKRRAKFRRKMWRRLGVHWDDAGQVQNAREFVKYPVKPADVQTILNQAGPGTLVDFYQAIRGLHIVQPMGDLRAIRATRKATARRITAFNRPDGRSLEETGDWNAMKRPLIAPTRERLNARLKLQEATLRQTLVRIARLKWAIFPGVALHDDEWTEAIARDEATKRPESPGSRSGSGVVNRVIARLSPAPYGSPICEPGVVVWGFNGDVEAVFRQPRVAAIRDEHRALYTRAHDARALACACAPAPRAARQSSQRSNNCPGDLWRVALAEAEADPPGIMSGAN